MRRYQPERAILPTINISSLGFADAHGVCQHGLKYWLQLAGRRADDPQHLRDRRPRLPRLLKFACLALKLFFQIGHRRMAAARGYRRAARRRLSGFATPCFHRFTACGPVPSHLALQFARRTIAYHSIELHCAPEQNQVPDFRNWSKRDRHLRSKRCPLLRRYQAIDRRAFDALADCCQHA